MTGRITIKMFPCIALTATLVAMAALGVSNYDSYAAGLNQLESAPRLAVVMVVDQMRADYLSRWEPQYTDGLHRLLTHGAYFPHAMHAHAHTVTAVGHATIATGAFPSHHGIVGNSYYDRTCGRSISAVADTTTTTLGGHGSTGASPHNLLRTALGDWLKHVSPSSKVFAASLKDRAAVFPGGKGPDCAFWYDKKTGDFVTSTYYTDALPDWTAAFDNSGLKDIWRDSLWIKSAPDDMYQFEDVIEAEKGGDQSDFPHTISGNTKTDTEDYYYGLYLTPFADAYLLDFCRQLLHEEHLGEDTVPDLLMISLSAADLVGHDYGPHSNEIQDYYLRLDYQLGRFLDSLDAAVGKGNYLFALTSDHGVCPLPELAVAMGMPDARRLMSDDFKADVARVLVESFPGCEHAASLLKYVDGGFVIDSAVASECGLSIGDAYQRTAAALEKLEYVADVFTYDQLKSTEDDRPFAGLFRNSFHPDRSPDLVVNFKEGVLLTSSKYGTSHGTPYHYDTDVPIVFYGPGVAAGRHNETVNTVDLAPTMAALMRIKPEKLVDGRILRVTK